MAILQLELEYLETHDKFVYLKNKQKGMESLVASVTYNAEEHLAFSRVSGSNTEKLLHLADQLFVLEQLLELERMVNKVEEQGNKPQH